MTRYGEHSIASGAQWAISLVLTEKFLDNPGFFVPVRTRKFDGTEQAATGAGASHRMALHWFSGFELGLLSLVRGLEALPVQKSVGAILAGASRWMIPRKVEPPFVFSSWHSKTF